MAMRGRMAEMVEAEPAVLADAALRARLAGLAPACVAGLPSKRPDGGRGAPARISKPAHIG